MHVGCTSWILCYWERNGVAERKPISPCLWAIQFNNMHIPIWHTHMNVGEDASMALKLRKKKRRCWERFPRDCHIYWTVSLLNYHVYERGMSASRYRCWNSRCSHIGWLATFNGQLYTWVFTVQTVVEKWMHCGYTLWCWSDLLEVNERTHSDRGCW